MSAAAMPAHGKLRALSRPVLARRLRLAGDRENLLDWQATPTGLLDQLCAMDLVAEAVRLLAYALPDREAVWWGCMCVTHTVAQSGAGQPGNAEREALGAAKAWVWHPGEAAARQAAWAAAAAGYHLPGAWTALAAYWSQQLGGEPGRAGRGIDTATTLAAGRGGQEAAAVLRRFIASGRDVAEGGPGRLPPLTVNAAPA
jgi:hypothetical protein